MNYKPYANLLVLDDLVKKLLTGQGESDLYIAPRTVSRPWLSDDGVSFLQNLRAP
jgi:hypothetical protein